MLDIEVGNFAQSDEAPALPDAFRVVNWNIARGAQLQSILEFLSGIKADLILLQEVDLNAKRTERLNIAREIAQSLRMNYVFGREFLECGEGSSDSPAFHGQATLSLWPLVDTRVLRFQRQSTFWQPRWFLPRIPAFQRRIGGRVALVCDVRIAGKMLGTYNLHLESRGNDSLRSAQLTECLEDSRRYGSDCPTLLAGDLNMDASRGSEADAIAAAEFRNVSTGPFMHTTNPRARHDRARCIDWIFARGPMCARQPGVHYSVEASDHYPLSVTLTF